MLDTFHFADMVAHVKLKSVRAEARQNWGSNYYPETEGSTSYYPEIWFEFEVIEYFKGSGSDIIWGIVAVHGGHGGQITASAIAAREVANQIIRHHIDPLHTGEAVVFMKDYYHVEPRAQQSNHYFLGSFLSLEGYSIRAGNRHWLPLASSDSDSEASEEPQFMLKHPDGNVAGYYPEEEPGTVGSPDNSVITLSELRYIAKNGRSLTERRVREDVNRQVRKAAQSLTAEVTGDAIILRWNVNSDPSVLNAVTGYRVLRQALQDDDETPFYTYYVDDYLGFLVLRYPGANLTELADVSPASTSMSYEDKSDISPGTKYVYLVRPYDPYGTDAYVMITATNGATATGTILPGVKFPTVTPTPTATPTPSPATTPTPDRSAAVQQTRATPG